MAVYIRPFLWCGATRKNICSARATELASPSALAALIRAVCRIAVAQAFVSRARACSWIRAEKAPTEEYRCN